MNETYTAVKKAAVDEDDDEQEEGEAKPKLRRQHGAHAGHAAAGTPSAPSLYQRFLRLLEKAALIHRPTAVIQIETRGVGPIQYRLDADHRRR